MIEREAPLRWRDIFFEMSALGLKSRTFPRGEEPTTAVERRQARFLACYAVCGMVSQAARWAKLERSCHAHWMKHDPNYPKRFALADEQFSRMILDTAHLVAVHGTEMPVLYKGKQVYIQGQPLVENKRSEQVLIRLLEARFPEEFRRRTEQVNLLELDPDSLSEKQLNVLVNAIIARSVGNDPEAIAATRRQLETVVETTAEVVEP
jgi:hypothetical protein